MRWGITVESVSAARTVMICLREVDRSDLFVGFFGQRYGWNGREDAALQANFDLASEAYPWLSDYRDRSITELEFIHGHLKNPGHIPALFCFRNRSYDDTCRAELLDQGNELKAMSYIVENAHSEKLLEELKSRVAQSEDKCIGVKSSYEEPKEMAEYVYRQLYDYIRDVLLANSDKLQEGEESSRHLAADKHDVFRFSRCRLYVGQQYVHRLDQLLEGSRRVLVYGDTGCGKSALVCNWLQTKLNARDDDAPVFAYHFVGFAPSSANVMNLLIRLIKKLCQHNPTLAPKEPTEVNEAYLALRSVLNTLSNQRVYILVDGVDKLKRAKKGQKPLFWLPRDLPENIIVIVTMTTGHHTDIFNLLVEEMSFKPFEVKPLSTLEKQKLVMEILRINSKELSDGQLTMVLNAPQTTNPLFLTTLIKELCVVDFYQKVDSKISELLTCAEVTSLFNKFVERLETDYCTPEYPEAIRQVLTSIVLLKHGIKQTDLTKFVELPSIVWIPIQYTLLPYLLDQDGYLTYEISELTNAISSRYLQNEAERIKTMASLADFMFTEYQERLTANVRQELLLLNAVDLFYKLHNQTKLREILCDLQSFQQLYQTDKFQCLEYWQSTGLTEREIGERLAAKLDVVAKQPGGGQAEKAAKFGELILEFFDVACYYKAKEIILYKIQNIVRESTTMKVELKSRHLDRIHYSLACLYSVVGQVDVSITLHKKLLDKRLKNPALEQTPDGRKLIADSYHGLATQYLESRGNLNEVYDMFVKSRDMYAADDKITRANTENNMGLVLIAMERYAEAQKVLEGVLQVYDESYVGEPPAEYGSFIINLALTHRKQNNLDEAERLYKKCLSFNVRLLGAEHLLVAKILLNLVNVYILRQDLEGALGVAERAMNIFLVHFPPDHPQCLMGIENSCDIYVKMQRWTDAEPLFWQAFEIRVKNHTIGLGLHHLYEAFMTRYVNRLEPGDLEKTAAILEQVILECENPRYYGVLAYVDSKLPEKPKRQENLSLDTGLAKYPKNMFNLNYKFKLDIMTDSVSTDTIMQFVRKHQVDWMDDATFILSVATWLVNDHTRYDLASPVLLYATGIFTNREQGLNDLLVRTFKHFADDNDYIGMLPLIVRLADLMPDISDNQLAACKVTAMNSRFDLTRKYCEHIRKTWPDDEAMNRTVDNVMEIMRDAEATLAHGGVSSSH